jgi:hypothetical protein
MGVVIVRATAQQLSITFNVSMSPFVIMPSHTQRGCFLS